jgi:nucleoside-diphosphate-sugar epimerase
MKSILITGCAGFIGSSLTEELLSQGFQVIGIDNFDDFYPRNIKEKNLEQSLKSSSFHFYEGDISNKDTFKLIEEKIECVIHIAAKAGVRPSIMNPQAYIQTNVTGTETLLNWMNENGIKKFVFASSSSVYGNNTPVPFSENAIVDFPISPYAFTKKACELLNHTYHHLYQFDILNLRFFTVYGERQRPDLAIHKFVDSIYKNQPITMYGEGDTSRDYTYIKDIVTGIIAAMNYVSEQSGVFETINIGNSSPISLKDLVSLIYELTDKTQNIQFHPKQAGDVDVTYSDISKAKTLLNYEPSTTLREGLKNFISWYKQQNNIID